MKKAVIICSIIGLLLGLGMNKISSWVGVPITLDTVTWTIIGLVAGLLVGLGIAHK